MGGFAASAGDPLNFVPAAPVGVSPEVGFTEALERNMRDGVRTRNAGVREEATHAELWERHRAIEKASGQKLPLPASLVDTPDGRQDFVERIGAPIVGAINSRILGAPGRVSDDAYEALVAQLREKAPETMAAIESREAMQARLEQNWTAIRADADESWGSTPGALGAFSGQALAALSDPRNLGVNLATGGWGAGRPLGARLLAQGAAGAGVEVLMIPDRIEDATYGGPAYTPEEAGLDILAGGAAGVVFEGVGSLARAGFQALNPESPGGQNATRRASQVRAAEVRDQAAIGPQDPASVEAAREALARGQAPRLEPARDLSELFTNAPPAAGRTPASGASETVEYYGRPIEARRFDPAEIRADPVRFQYKDGADAEGVTARLRGIEAWDPTASGKVIVWQDRAGEMFIADGHQRRALAQRMSDKGWDAQLDGFLLREADGWSASEARVVAALKNIREGSGSPLDAAKVFREAPGLANERSLPVTGDFMSQGRGLARLSDEAFGAVVNQVVPERYGADIGNLAHARPDLHMPMVRLLREAEPANGDEARALIVEALQDDWIRREGDQSDLFGYDGTTSAMIARAKVAANVKRALAKDARLYGQLVKNADAIEAGGNALARDANEARLATDKAALEITSKLAMRSGPIGEAMAAAAAKVARGENVTGAAREVLERVRQAIAAGEDLEAARGVMIDPEPPSPAARELVEAFDDPHGEGAKAQADLLAAEADAPPGLFDDLPETGVYERARAAALTCATGA